MEPLDLIAVGEVMLDVESPVLAESGRRLPSTLRVRPGGSSITAAIAARRRGGQATVVGRIGDDAAGRSVRAELEREGIEPFFAVDAEAPTGTFLALGSDASAVLVHRGANARLAPEDLPALEGRVLLVSGYTLLHEDARAAGVAALARARSGVRAVDAASAPLLGRVGGETFLESTRSANVLLANDSEARVLTGLSGEAAAVALAERYEIACVKLGAAGAVAVRAGEVCRSPAAAAAATLGDGDAFAGGFLLALAGSEDLEAALTAGADAAATL